MSVTATTPSARAVAPRGKARPRLVFSDFRDAGAPEGSELPLLSVIISAIINIEHKDRSRFCQLGLFGRRIYPAEKIFFKIF